MKRVKLLATTLTAATLLIAGSGCTQTDETETLSVPLSFSTTVEDVQTRGEDFTTSNLTSMGVFAYLTNGEFITSATPNYMYNQAVTKNSGTNTGWTYSPTKYWPTNGTDKISFFAYAPKDASGVALSDATHANYPYLTYTVPAEEAGQTDLLAATPQMNKSGGTVNFPLNHALTKVKFVVKSGDGNKTEKALHSFSVKAKASGQLTYNATGFSWGNMSGNTTTFTPANNTDITVPGNGTADIATFYLLPDNTGASFSMKYTIQETIASEGMTLTNTVTITDKDIATSPAWEAGKVITYTITITKTELTVEATGGTWEEDSNKEIQLFVENEIKIGDYYYSDGSWSDGGLRAVNEATGETILANPIPGSVPTNPETGAPRTCIGLILYLGRHSEDQGVYLNRNGASLTVKGYVLGFKETAEAAWGSSDYNHKVNKTFLGTIDSTTDFNGYYNSQLIRASDYFNDSQCYRSFKECINYSVSADADKTSVWFMPSAGQALYMSKFRQTLLDPIRKRIGQSALYTGYSCLTSTEASTYNQIQVTWDGFVVISKYLAGTSYSILAFTY